MMIRKSEINDYIRRLTERYMEISEIWFIGSRANNENVRKDSDWDFIVFSTNNILDKLKNEIELKNAAISLNIDLLVENDQKEFKSAWATKRISIESLQFQKLSSSTAKYMANKYRKRTSQERAYLTEFERYEIKLGADDSVDVSDWKMAIKVWPSD